MITKNKNKRKMKRKDVQKKKLIDVLCASNIKNASEQHVLSKNVRTFYLSMIMMKELYICHQ